MGVLYFRKLAAKHFVLARTRKLDPILCLGKCVNNTHFVHPGAERNCSLYVLGVGRKSNHAGWQTAGRKTKWDNSLEWHDRCILGTGITDIQLNSLVLHYFTLFPRCPYFFFLKCYRLVFPVFDEWREKPKRQPDRSWSWAAEIIYWL